MRRALLLVAATVGAGGLLLLGPAQEEGTAERAPARSRAAAVPQGIPGMVKAARARIAVQPDDARAWSDLGTAYVEQARLTADPSYLTKAQGALRKSLDLRPRDNADALVGMGTLANARHEFPAAKRWARKAQRLDPTRWMPYGVLSDAQLQLGDYRAAGAALQKMLDLRPGVASYTRAAHYLELTGHPERADEALRMAVSAATSPADLAFCHQRRGELAWNTGHPRDALAAYGRALAADPEHAPSLAGRGRVKAAQGRTEEGLRDYAKALELAPHPALVLELGELYAALGRPGEAKEQFALFTATQRLFTAGGVTDGLALGRYEADHGDPAAAVRHLRAEWRKAPAVEVADALGWALHRAGRDDEALPLAKQAMRLKSPRAETAYHRGEIERALGMAGPAREHLAEALRLNPHFSPMHAPKARAALAELRKANV